MHTTAMHTRPLGVSILAILDFVGAAMMLLCGIGLAVGIAAAFHVPVVSALGAVGGVIFIMVGLVPALLGWGLWTLHNWARVITIIFAILGLVGAALGLLSAETRLTSLLPLVVNGAIAWYMFRGEVKEAFS